MAGIAEFSEFDLAGILETTNAGVLENKKWVAVAGGRINKNV